MKKNKIVIVLLLIVLSIVIFILLGINLLKKEHRVNYEINKYKVEEKFDKNHYIIKITKGKNVYLYYLNNQMNKNKKIIKSITTVKSNDLKCIIPNYKKNISKKIYCQLDGKQVSINYLLQTDNPDFEKIKDVMKKNKINIPKQKEKQTTYKKINMYKDNFNNKKMIIWDYKGIYILGKTEQKYKKILKKDLYDNIMSTIVNNNYVLFDNTSVNGIEMIYYYDLKKDKLKSFKLENKISKKSYINGVKDGLIYITDKSAKKEYTLDIKSKKLAEIDNNQTEYILFKNNEKIVYNKSDFFMKEQYFNNYSLVSDKIDSDDMKESIDYYYYVKNGDFYKVIKGYENNPVLLFHTFDIKDWFIINDTIYLTKQDTVYSYTEENGLKKLIQYNELRYNYKNIYNIWEK